MGTDTGAFLNFRQEDPNATELMLMVEMGMDPAPEIVSPALIAVRPTCNAVPIRTVPEAAPLGAKTVPAAGVVGVPNPVPLLFSIVIAFDPPRPSNAND